MYMCSTICHATIGRPYSTEINQEPLDKVLENVLVPGWSSGIYPGVLEAAFLAKGDYHVLAGSGQRDVPKPSLLLHTLQAKHTPKYKQLVREGRYCRYSLNA